MEGKNEIMEKLTKVFRKYDMHGVMVIDINEKTLSTFKVDLVEPITGSKFKVEKYEEDHSEFVGTVDDIWIKEQLKYASKHVVGDRSRIRHEMFRYIELKPLEGGIGAMTATDAYKAIRLEEEGLHYKDRLTILPEILTKVMPVIAKKCRAAMSIQEIKGRKCIVYTIIGTGYLIAHDIMDEFPALETRHLPRLLTGDRIKTVIEVRTWDLRAMLLAAQQIHKEGFKAVKHQPNPTLVHLDRYRVGKEENLRLVIPGDQQIILCAPAVIKEYGHNMHNDYKFENGFRAILVGAQRKDGKCGDGFMTIGAQELYEIVEDIPSRTQFNAVRLIVATDNRLFVDLHHIE